MNDARSRLLRLALLALVAAGAPAAAPAPQAGGPKLGFPLACQIGLDCEVQHYVDRDPGPGVRDYRCHRRTYEGHSGVDIRVPDMNAERAGVNVLAAAAGRVTRLRDGVPDISIRAAGAPSVQGQECGNGVVIDHGQGWETQYCHLKRGSLRVASGDVVAAGAAIGQVGLSGNTEFPHLHFNLRHDGRIVDPFAPDMTGGACRPQVSMWTPAALRQMAYKEGAVLNAGFASGPVSMADVEAGGAPPPTPQGPYLIAYARAIELEAGDVVELVLSGPGGRELAASRVAPLQNDQAQHIAYVGKRRPAEGWPPGKYSAVYRVYRGGRMVLERRFQVGL